jgi:hypothetical protein
MPRELVMARALDSVRHRISSPPSQQHFANVIAALTFCNWVCSWRLKAACMEPVPIAATLCSLFLACDKFRAFSKGVGSCHCHGVGLGYRKESFGSVQTASPVTSCTATGICCCPSQRSLSIQWALCAKTTWLIEMELAILTDWCKNASL